MNKLIPYNDLVKDIGHLLQKARKQAIQTVNNLLVNTYWHTGQHIVEFEQHGKEKATYGAELLNKLSKDLTLAYGKGFSRSNLFQIRNLYLKFPKIQTLSGQLSRSYYFEILKADSDREISFYTRQCEKENRSVREPKRQMKSMLFHRLALSTDKKGVLKMAEKGLEIQRPEDILKDPYIFEFLGIPQSQQYLEGELEEKLIQNRKTTA